MKAIRVARAGGPEVLQLVELPTPQPGAGEALVHVEAAGVNFIDVYHRTGVYPRQLPFLLGEEGAGRVETVGPRADHLPPRHRLPWARGPASYATHLGAPADDPLPPA